MESKRELDAALKSLRMAINDVGAIGRSIGQLRAIYTEVFVASKLSDKGPQMGDEREVRSADVYLSKIHKRVEVKAAEKQVFSGEGDFAWSIGLKQLTDHKFDYLVAIGYSSGLDIERVFVFTADDFKGEHSHNPDFIRDLAGIGYGADFPGHTSLERSLHAHPERYENRWDRIV